MSVRPRPALLILESHPVQYHAPVYREACRLAPGKIKVVYATDCTVRGFHDPEFGRNLVWDEPLLEGYPVQVLNSERGEPLRGPFSLHGRDIVPFLWRERPRVVLFASQLYEFSWAAYLCCLILGIDIWWRVETQDEAHSRGTVKSWIRAMVYRVVYAPLAGAFYVGELNRRHLAFHGVPSERLRPALYCVVDRLAGVSKADKQSRRAEMRRKLGVSPDTRVVAFFGKLIPKKNPALLLHAWGQASPMVRTHWQLLFVGDGELRAGLEQQAMTLIAKAHFAGFINQRGLPDYYLAADIVVLPSRREGETWGLVVNEALQAGCAVAVSAAAGCAAEFGAWERVRVLPEDDDGSALMGAVKELASLERDFDWCRDRMKNYSIEAAAAAIASAAQQLSV